MKISFNNDYSEGAHPSILKKIVEKNLESNIGYSNDDYCKQANKLILDEIDCPTSKVHFFVGGTQTNLTFIASVLRPHQAVICCESGHINVHETGSVEATGHKVISTPAVLGKVSIEEIDKCLKHHQDEHMVMPKMVYISNSTEIGTIYTKKELIDLYNYCKENNLYLFVDGARLGSAITAKNNDTTLKDFAKYCDAFYIGGTKHGLLFGEALVINNIKLEEGFRFIMKQKGALLAKGFLLGIQFKELFSNKLFYNIGKHENEMAEKIQDAFVKKGIELYINSQTNQIFPVFNEKQYKKLEKKYLFSVWEKIDSKRIITRFVTSWATKQEDVDNLINDINDL